MLVEMATLFCLSFVGERSRNWGCKLLITCCILLLLSHYIQNNICTDIGLMVCFFFSFLFPIVVPASQSALAG